MEDMMVGLLDIEYLDVKIHVFLDIVKLDVEINCLHA
jgi:hypothetical protein